MFPNTIVLHLDFHKPLRTPKCKEQDSYYTVKVITHLFGIYCANDDKLYCFFYDDSIGGTGPNEVISLLDVLLGKLRTNLGPLDHLIVWCDNSPSQFKEQYLFFYLDYIVKRGDFLRADLKFMLEGHTYSYCDRRFGSVQSLLNRHEVVEVPQQWATIVRESGLTNVNVYWVTLDMIKDYKSFLKLQYVARNEDSENEKFAVSDIAWLNFGYGELANREGDLELVHHPDSVFLRFKMDAKQCPKTVSYVKKKQAHELKPELLKPVSQVSKPVSEDAKKGSFKLADKYLTPNAKRFYNSLRCIEKETE